MEFELTVTRGALPSTPGLEPCESCGTPITLYDMMSALRRALGLGERESQPEWLEIHRFGNESDAVTMQMRPHTPLRCRRVRAGKPEPWTPLGDEDDD